MILDKKNRNFFNILCKILIGFNYGFQNKKKVLPNILFINEIKDEPFDVEEEDAENSQHLEDVEEDRENSQHLKQISGLNESEKTDQVLHYYI
ncbi:hypothetical protein Avbf_07171 [Armadillidium vulgare]|nr:hypothetical protein Avbf_07171 [Armadillidium vulgare]